jgi:hypothetical protein
MMLLDNHISHNTVLTLMLHLMNCKVEIVDFIHSFSFFLHLHPDFKSWDILRYLILNGMVNGIANRSKWYSGLFLLYIYKFLLGVHERA